MPVQCSVCCAMDEKRMGRVRIKMCGTTRREDAEYAVRIGIDALGFIFVKNSPRYIDPEHAGRLISELPPFVSRVGVFVNQSLDAIKIITAAAGLTQLQLHGDESPEFCRDLKRWNASLSICKAFSVGGARPVPPCADYAGAIDSVLLDTYVHGAPGGTGKTFDWSRVQHFPIHCPLILAGGLNPDNVEKAVLVVNPYAVDINSGVEDQPGIKNHQLLAKLVANVRRTEIFPGP